MGGSSNTGQLSETRRRRIAKLELEVATLKKKAVEFDKVIVRTAEVSKAKVKARRRVSV